MTEKFSVYAGEPLASVLAGYETERSARVNQVCADWRELISAAVPKMSVAQWLAVIDCLNGTMIDDDATMRHAWAEVSDSTEICEKWEVDQAGLVATLRAMKWPELMAVRETIRRYWLVLASAEVMSNAEALRLAGAGLSDAAAA